MTRLGELETLVREDDRFAAGVAAADLVRTAARTLKAMRERAGFTQSELGEAIGLTQGRISQLESGLMDHAPNLETIALYAHACGESMSLEASGGREAEADPVFSVYEFEPRAGSPRLELVCNVPAIRSAMIKKSGITAVRGSGNRVRLAPALSANVMHELGIK
jgi:transcriptional regulator with XRE-family HTH domain